MGIRIAEWDARYEVNERNHEWKPGDKKRKAPLHYIRSTCRGRDQGVGYRYLLAVAGDLAPAVFGVFHKLLEIAGAEPGDRRDGTIRNQHGQPASVEDLAFIMGFPLEIVARSIEVLCDSRLGWVEMVPGDHGDPGGIPEIPECSGNPGNPRESRLKTKPIPKTKQEKSNQTQTQEALTPGNTYRGARGQAASSGAWGWDWG